MLDVKRVTATEPTVILPRGVRWIYIARTTTLLTVHTSNGGQIVATFGRNGSGDVMVPEEFTQLYFQFHFNPNDSDSITEQAYAVVYFSNEPIRVSRVGDIVYIPENAAPIGDINQPYERMAYPIEGLFYAALASQVTGIVSTDIVNGLSTPAPIMSALGGPRYNAQAHLATVTSPRRARTIIANNSQGGSPYAMLASFAAAGRIPIFEIDTSLLSSPLEVFLNSLTVDLTSISAANLDIVVDVMYMPPGYSMVGGATAESVEVSDIGQWSINHPYTDLVSFGGLVFRRSTNMTSVAADTDGYVIARRILQNTTVNQSARFEMISRNMNLSGRESPVQFIQNRTDTGDDAPVIIVVLQCSNAANIRVFIEASLSVIQPLRGDNGNIWT